MTSVIKSLIAISAVLGSHSLATLLPRNDGPTAPPCGVPFTPYLYAGCYTDPKSPRALVFAPVALNRQNMTVETCAAVCKGTCSEKHSSTLCTDVFQETISVMLASSIMASAIVAIPFEVLRQPTMHAPSHATAIKVRPAAGTICSPSTWTLPIPRATAPIS